jgi:two-component system chemotaxis response regulator CheY
MTKKVMIVDDSSVVRQQVTSVLAEAGFGVVEASDGQEGLERLKSEEIALVLCDINMPRMNGLDMLERASIEHKDVPFLMLTTEGRPALLARAKALGAKGWVVKPFVPDLLVATVRKLTT